MSRPLLTVDGLTAEYWTKRRIVRAVEDVSFTLEKAETLGVVGESGCGKTTMGLSLIRLIPYPGRIVKGKIKLKRRDLMNLSKDEMRNLRGKEISFVFQDPMTSLNPVKKIGAHFVELIRTHEPRTSEKEAFMRTCKLLEELGIKAERINDYPHQLSGGMRQRVMIALAIALNPSIVIADEPTTALDVIVQAKILDLLGSLRDNYGLALVLITHDLSIVLERTDKIIVMYAGHIVEYARSGDLYSNSQHPYTQKLLKSIPNIELAEQKLEAISGSPPDLLSLPKGCRFWPRCHLVMEKCKQEEPALKKSGPQHLVRCFRSEGEEET